MTLGGQVLEAVDHILVEDMLPCCVVCWVAGRVVGAGGILDSHVTGIPSGVSPAARE